MTEILHVAQDCSISWIGPPQSQGALPGVFYFALSAAESLELDPYNQPALYLANYPLRVFSMDLPAHGAGRPAVDAIQEWALELSRGTDPISSFVEKASFALDSLIEKKLLLKDKIGVMGLSRGGLIGAHLAAKRGDIAALLAFAPLTHLSFAKECSAIKDLPLVQNLDFPKLIPFLSSQVTRFYIGNRDTRVSTRLCYESVDAQVNAAFESGLRSPPVELILRPSIGHMGHGTGKETFQDGAHWIGKKIGAIR